MPKDDTDKLVNRRQLLKTGGAALATGLAGCTGGGDGGGSSEGGSTDGSDGGSTDSSNGGATDSSNGGTTSGSTSPPARVQPYMDRLPDYYPDEYGQIIDGAMDEGSLSIYTAKFGAMAEDMYANFSEKFDFLDVEFVTLGTAETYQRAASEASRGLWEWDAFFTWDAMLHRTAYEDGLAQTYVSPEISQTDAFSENDQMGIEGQVRQAHNLTANSYNPEHFGDGREVPRTIEEVTDAMEDDPDFWTNFWGMNDGITSTTAWQLMDFYAEEFSEEKMVQEWEQLAEYDPLTYNTDATYTQLLGNGEVGFGLANTRWTMSKLFYPQYPDLIEMTDFATANVQYAGYTIAQEASNPNAAKLLVDWWYSRDLAEHMANQWHMTPARRDLDPDNLPTDRFWDIPLEINSIQENIDYYDSIFQSFEKRSQKSQTADEYKQMWYDMFGS